MKSSRTLFSKDFGGVYCDAKTRELRHQFPVMARFDGDEMETPCIFDIAAADVVRLQLIGYHEDEWIVTIPVSTFRFIEKGETEHRNQVCKIYECIIN